MTGFSNGWKISNDERIYKNSVLIRNSDQTLPLIALLRVRNEELIIKDTLDHLSSFADIIVAYDDASTDETLSILTAHPKVGLVIMNQVWQEKVEQRLIAETRHRGLLLKEARKNWNARWIICCDADERYIGPIRKFVCDNAYIQLPDAVRLSLFDAYLTVNDCESFVKGNTLLDSRTYFGPERRDILILWKNKDSVEFRGVDSREPQVQGSEITMFHCQHYGKSLSITHWEDTCKYYFKYFPFEPYGRKWSARMGKAIHTKSDFNRDLFTWGPDLFENSVRNF